MSAITMLQQSPQKGRDFTASAAEREYGVGHYGSMPMADWLHMLVARGMAYHVSIGAFSTPITGGGDGTIFDQDQPEGVLSVPSGFTMIPLRIHIQAQTPLLATDADESEILIAVDRAASWDQTGTRTAEQAFNLRTDMGDGSPVLCASAFTANCTNPTLAIELARSVMVGDVQGTPATALYSKHELLYEPKYPPFIVGPAAIYLYWGGTVATPGFAQCQFAAMPSTLVKALV